MLAARFRIFVAELSIVAILDEDFAHVSPGACGRLYDAVERLKIERLVRRAGIGGCGLALRGSIPRLLPAVKPWVGNSSGSGGFALCFATRS